MCFFAKYIKNTDRKKCFILRGNRAGYGALTAFLNHILSNNYWKFLQRDTFNFLKTTF